jgi:hypothetical protein
MTQEQRVTGFEISRQFEDERKTIRERAKISKKEVKSIIVSFIPLFIIFLVGCWLAGNPFDATMRATDSVYNQSHSLVGTNLWQIVPAVLILGLIFEFLDASAGMGFGTCLTPILLIMGFTPLQVVPAIMIEQATCGLIGTFLHQEFKNVEWRFSPMSETIKLWLLIAGLGCCAVAFSITAIYAIFKVHKIWIKLYVTLLLLFMGIVALLQSRSKKVRNYRPKLMTLFGFLAGFNKGIGGGGYGPVVTVGGLLSGIPVKSQLAVTAISEGTVSSFAVLVWFLTLTAGVHIDFILLPTMMIAAIGSGIMAPFAVRIFPEKVWNYVVPIYCLVCVAICFYKIGPDLISHLS